MPDDLSDLTTCIGTPGEYTDDLYRVYFEVGEFEGIAHALLVRFLADRCGASPVLGAVPSTLRATLHGYEIDLPLQLVPEVVAALVGGNIGVYQVLRLGKLPVGSL